MAYLYGEVRCPLCDEAGAQVTYEEQRVYQLKCPHCEIVIRHKDYSWDAAFRFFSRMVITEEAREDC